MIRQFLKDHSEERINLMRELEHLFSFPSAPLKELMAQIGMAAVNAKQTPVQLLGCGIMYGMALGIRMEKERASRKQRVM